MIKFLILLVALNISFSAFAMDKHNIMTLYVGQSEFINDDSIKRIAVGSDEIITALPIQDKGILLTGIKSGDTSIQVWRKDSVQHIDAHVYPANLLRIFDDIKHYLDRYPEVKANIIGDRIVLEGLVSDQANAERLTNFLSQYQYVTNLTQIKNLIPTQNDNRMVYLDVKIVEVSRKNMQNLGIQWDTGISGPKLGIIGEMKKSKIYRSENGLGLDSIPTGNPIGPFQTYAGLITSLSSRINLMESQGTAKLIAHPILSCKNGGTAEFLSGGQIPFSTASATGTPSIEFKDYGIKLNVSPVIQNDGSIVAKITSEISEVDSAVQTAGIPGLLTRKTNTDFNLKNGQTLVLSGLNYNRNSEGFNKVPGLHKVPFVGSLFKNKEKNSSQIELLFIVTPYIYSDEENQNINQNISKKVVGLTNNMNESNILLPKDFFSNKENRIPFDKSKMVTEE